MLPIYQFIKNTFVFIGSFIRLFMQKYVLSLFCMFARHVLCRIQWAIIWMLGFALSVMVSDWRKRRA